jgi:hypothetical protein
MVPGDLVHSYLPEVKRSCSVSYTLFSSQVMALVEVGLDELRVAGFMIRLNLQLVFAKCILDSKRLYFRAFIAVMDDR